MTGVVYILMKQCGECLAINRDTEKTCMQCGELFIREASEEEKLNIYQKHENMKKKASR